MGAAFSICYASQPIHAVDLWEENKSGKSNNDNDKVDRKSSVIGVRVQSKRDPNVDTNDGEDGAVEGGEENENIAEMIKKPQSSLQKNKSTLFHSKSLKQMISPPKKAGVQHPAAWMIHSDVDPDWCMYLDENENTYFYNTITQESSWDTPPHLGSLKLPSSDFSITVIVPPQAIPGESFTMNVGEIILDIMCPKDVVAGEELILLCPSTSTSSTPESNEEGFVENANAPVEDVDATTAWAAFASAANLDFSDISMEIDIARNVLMEVSQGCYLEDLLFQLSWAYKVGQMELAVRDCVKCGGDFADSSKYDNCDGIPKYPEGGMFLWWEDLHDLRMVLEKEMETAQHNRFFDETLFVTKSGTDFLSSKEASVLSGDDKTLLDGLLERKKQVEMELNNVIARVLAIVSIEGGPPRESMEVVHTYFKDSLDKDDSDFSDQQDEIEELVSNQLQPRHKFVVDILLNMALLETELEHLEQQITNFEASKSHPANEIENENKDSASIIDNNNKKNKNDDDENIVANDIVRSLIANQADQAAKLEQSLLADKEAKSKLLKERLMQKRNQKIAELQSQGMSEADAIVAANDEVSEESAIELDKMNKEIDKSMKEFHLKALAELKKVGAEEEERLVGRLEAEKSSAHSKLQEKLDLKRRKLQQELESKRTPDGTLSENDVADYKNDCNLVDVEAEEGSREIEKKKEEHLRNHRATILADIKNQHDIEMKRLNDELIVQQENRKRALKIKLEKKLKQKATEILDENPLSVQETVALLESQLREEEKAGVIKIESEIKSNKLTQEQELLNSLKELNDKQMVVLQNELKHQQDTKKKRLTDRLQKKREQLEYIANVDPTKAKEIENAIEFVGTQGKVEMEKALEEMNDNYQKETENLQNILNGENEKKESKKNSSSIIEDNSDNNNVKDDSISFDTFMKELKIEQQQQLNNLLLLIEKCKKDALNTLSQVSLEKRRGSNFNTSDDADVDGLNESKVKTKLLMLFTVMSEYMVLGFKKRCLYLSKSIKAVASSSSSSSSSQSRVSSSEIARFRSLEFINSACNEATDSLLSRLKRDLKGMIDTQHSERVSNINTMKENGSSRIRILESELKHDDFCREALAIELQKTMCTLSGIYINTSILTTLTSDNSKLQNENGIDEEEDLFADDDGGIGSPSQASIVAFKDESLDWIRSASGLLQTFSDAPTSLFCYLGFAHAKVVLMSRELIAAQDLSREVKNTVACTMITEIIIDSFRSLVTLIGNDIVGWYKSHHDDNNYSTISEIPVFISSTVLSTYKKESEQSKDSAIELIFASLPQKTLSICSSADSNSKSSNTESSDIMVSSSESMAMSIAETYRQGIKFFLNKPILTFSEEFIEKKKTLSLLNNDLKSSSSASLKSSAQSQSAAIQKEAKEREKELILSLESKMEKKKKDLEEKLRKKRLLKAPIVSSPNNKDESSSSSAIGVSNDDTDNNQDLKEDMDKWNSYTQAFEEVKSMLLSSPEVNLHEVTADGLMLAIDKKTNGEIVGIKEIVSIQQEVQDEYSKQQVQKVLRQQLESANKLDVALQMKKAKDSQALQNRLMKRKGQTK